MAPRAPEGERPQIVGPDNGPEPPFPIYLSGPVVKGFGRGSKELGIPTANIPLSGLSVGGHDELESGIYYGWVGLNVTLSGEKIPSSTSTSSSSPPGTIFPSVLSIGYNPFYKNTVRSVEVHVMHAFAHDFYDSRMNLMILGYIRPEYDYAGVEKLIEDIRTDIEVARRSLGREGYQRFKNDGYLLKFEGEGHEEKVVG